MFPENVIEEIARMAAHVAILECELMDCYDQLNAPGLWGDKKERAETQERVQVLQARIRDYRQAIAELKAQPFTK